jgi:hypothetical protein
VRCYSVTMTVDNFGMVITIFGHSYFICLTILSHSCQPVRVESAGVGHATAPIGGLRTMRVVEGFARPSRMRGASSNCPSRRRASTSFHFVGNQGFVQAVRWRPEEASGGRGARAS